VSIHGVYPQIMLLLEDTMETRELAHLLSFPCLSQFPAVLAAILVSTIPVSILGTHFAMEVVPFWTPEQYREFFSK
jgi:hypothetical protein